MSGKMSLFIRMAAVIVAFAAIVSIQESEASPIEKRDVAEVRVRRDDMANDHNKAAEDKADDGDDATASSTTDSKKCTNIS